MVVVRVVVSSMTPSQSIDHKKIRSAARVCALFVTVPPRCPPCDLLTLPSGVPPIAWDKVATTTLT